MIDYLTFSPFSSCFFEPALYSADMPGIADPRLAKALADRTSTESLVFAPALILPTSSRPTVVLPSQLIRTREAARQHFNDSPRLSRCYLALPRASCMTVSLCRNHGLAVSLPRRCVLRQGKVALSQWGQIPDPARNVSMQILATWLANALSIARPKLPRTRLFVGLL